MEEENDIWKSVGKWLLVVVIVGGGYRMFFNPEQATNTTSVKSNCHSSYSGCLKTNAGDYDCAGGSGNGPNYTGRVRVIGPDVFGLDRDKDGWGCE